MKPFSRRWGARTIAFGLFVISTAASAQSSVSMGDIQNAANRSGDKSMSLLELVYGSVVHNPLASGGGAGGMIAQLFLVLNSCMLAVGAIWAMYHFGSAMIATGQDGEFMGQKKSSPWFIIRLGVGFTGLVPIFGGYCGAQMVMLWGTMLGVGIANLSLDAAVSVLNSGGSMIATPASPQATTLAKALFEANLCAQAANTAIANMPNDSGVSVDPAENFTAITTSNKVVLMNQRGLSCGGAEIDITQPPTLPSYDGMAVYSLDPGSIYSQMLSAHQNALSTLQSTLSAAAQAYVSSVNGQTQPADPQNTINQAALQYQTTISQAISNSSTAISGLASVIQSNLQRDGWIMMGAWYQTFAQANSQVTTLANATAAAVPGTDADNMPYPQLYRKVSATYAQQNQQDASTSTTQSLVSNLTTGTTDPKNFLSKIFPGQQIVQMAINLNSGQGPAGSTNPLIGMKNLGDYILDAGWTALGAYAVWKGLEGASDSNVGKLIGVVGDVATGGMLGAAKGAAKGVLDALAPFVVIMCITLFFFGAMLSIYIPMLPFIIWFSGVLSWYAVVGESMVASPLWAMTHLDGEGEGMGQRPTHGYIFLLNVMFRPVFMEIGFVLAGAGIVVLGTLLNTMFGVAMQNAQYDSTTGLVSIIGYIVLYVGMCQTLCNSTFSLIHIVPDQVFSWVGGQMASRMPELEDRVNRLFGTGVGHGGSNARGLGTSLGGGGPGTPAGPSATAPVGKMEV
ncbi:IncI1 plasmid conjugative transfer integral membrane protein TraY [Candidatus Burkholderia verschuerenii]|uniref:IncI1 plasmid conjugative transfer integral membrane protein TraY n=2 Tax=Candidatus Burkholderia verschuerenii TaxID=242163 RepID=A0A0L0MJ62_9BURK|nr:IncI1 plasmid conjugative transfer integral membrane protein TraY [Candidatus Burkholderia verschuerenii]